MNGPIPVFRTLGQACLLMVRNRDELLRVGLVFLAWNYVFSVVNLFIYARATATAAHNQAAGSSQSPVFMLVEAFVLSLLFSVFAVGWHRAILLGANRPDGRFGVQLGRREFRHLGHIWLCFIGILGAFVLFTLVGRTFGNALAAGSGSLIWLAVGGFCLATGYVLARAGPTFAALSIDRPFGFGQSWKATAGNGFRLLAIHFLAAAFCLLAILIFILVTSAVDLERVVPFSLLLILSSAVTLMLALLVTINAIVFRQLTSSQGIV